jgi:hypothetical protein
VAGSLADAMWAAQAQRKKTEAAAKEAFFREALQELTLFKSRTSAALLQAQEQLHSATVEAQGMEATYLTAWTTAQASHTQNTALLQQLSEVRSATCKLMALPLPIPNARSRPPVLLGGFASGQAKWSSNFLISKSSSFEARHQCPSTLVSTYIGSTARPLNLQQSPWREFRVSAPRVKSAVIPNLREFFCPRTRAHFERSCHRASMMYYFIDSWTMGMGQLGLRM